MTTTTQSGGDRSFDAVSAAKESNVRRERFSVAGAVTVDARTASGVALVRVGASDACEVTVSAKNRAARERLGEVEISYDESSRTLMVITQPRSLSRRWIFDIGRSDFNVELAVPEGSDLKVRTASGDVRATGTFGQVAVSSASGQVFLGEVRGSCEVTLASGDAEIHEVHGPVRVKTASGDVTVRRAHDDARLQSVSGNVELGVAAGLEARLNSVSGNILVRLDKGLAVDVDASTVSGDLRSEIDLSGPSGVSVDGVTVTIKASTVSGDVKVRRA